MIRALGATRSLYLPLALIAALLTVPTSFSLAETFTYSITLPKAQIRIETVGSVSRIDLGAVGYERLGDEGQPALPYRVLSVLLPPGEGVESFSFEVSPSLVVGSGDRLEIAAPMVSEDGVAGKGAPLAEVGSGVFPKRSGRYLGTGYLQGCGIASFALFPVRVEGGDVTLSETVTVHITTGYGLDREVVVRERHRAGHRERLAGTLKRLVVNPEMVGSYGADEVRVEKRPGGFQPTSYPSLEGSAVDYLIITTDALSGEYQRLADWKTAKGIPAVVRTVEWIEANTRNGVDIQETIRFFIQDAYAKWGITYLLLGGDTDIMPPRYALSRFYQGGLELPVDMYFSCLDGSWNDDHDASWGEVLDDVPDLYAEIYNGRFPMSESADVSALIDKIISYELAVNTEYLDRYLGLAEVLFPPSWVEGETIELNGGDVMEFVLAIAMTGHTMDLVRMYETEELFPGSVNENRQAVIDSLNAGFNLVNHLGHGYRVNMSVGDASVINQDADALINDGEWFNLYMLNCTAAAFNFNCLAEHFLKNHSGGAVSVIGANESAFVSASTNYMTQYYDLLFHQDVGHVGDAFARSRLMRTPVAMLSDNVDLWTHYIYTILADPEMTLFTEAAGTLDVTHITNVGFGKSSILFNVTSGGQPVDSAYVCLTKDGEDYQFGATSALGNVIIDFSAESPGSISVVVTARNCGRVQSSITVDPSAGAYVSFAGLTIDDDGSGGTFGNNDGVVDAGEAIEFTLDLSNTGEAPSDSVWFVLRSTDTLATVLDSIGEVGVLAAGETMTALDPVRVMFDATITDGAVIAFALEVHDASAGLWNDAFNKVVHAPKLDLVTLRIDDDPPLGNGNGIVEAMEEFKLYYGIKNYGTGTANALVAGLEDVSGVFTFIDSTDGYPDLGPFESAENISGFHLIEANTAGENLLRLAITDLFGHVYVDTIELRSPQPPSNLVFDSSLGSDRLEVSWDHSPSPDIARYNVFHSLTSGGPYQLANVDPLDHTVYLDANLLPNTIYHFVIKGIDSSGNQSDFSSEFAASTNPPQVAGFPIGTMAQTTSSPAVGDIDGDGDLEIVVGNRYVYALHHDGNEVVDGDSDPVTWGVLNTAGSDFTAAVSLAELDGIPGLDIIAADLLTRSVYCMNHTGALLAGWPQAAENDFRANPVAGDLDGDGLLEVVAVDSRGVVYAWHRNGVEVRDGDNNPLTQGVFYRTPLASFHYMPPAVCDIDGDNEDEIILGTRADTVYCWNGDGSSVPGWPFASAGELAGGVVVGDVDGDMLPEVVVRSKTSEIYLLNHDGTLAPNWPVWIPMNDPFFAPSPALADLDEDGTLEIILAHRTVESRLYIINHDATNYPGWPIVYSSDFTESSPTVADIDGDGSPDILLGDESRFLRAWDLSGNVLDGFPISSPEPFRATPYLTDVDFDGDMDMVVHGWDQRIYLYDFGGTYNPNRAHWPTVQGGSGRSGQYRSDHPTGIGGAAFTFSVSHGAVDLAWLLPSLQSNRFNIARSVAADAAERDFVSLFTGATADAQGMVRFRDRDVEMGTHYVYRLESVVEKDVFITESIYVPISRAELRQNFPNPFNPDTRIVYYVPEGTLQHVSLVIFDVSGARVRTLLSGQKKSGRYEAVWDGRDNGGNRVGSGVYFYRLETKGFVATKKMLLLK